MQVKKQTNKTQQQQQNTTEDSEVLVLSNRSNPEVSSPGLIKNTKHRVYCAPGVQEDVQTKDVQGCLNKALKDYIAGI